MIYITVMLPDEIVMLIMHFARDILSHSENKFIEDIKIIGSRKNRFTCTYNIRHIVSLDIKHLHSVKNWFDNRQSAIINWMLLDTIHLN